MLRDVKEPGVRLLKALALAAGVLVIAYISIIVLFFLVGGVTSDR